MTNFTIVCRSLFTTIVIFSSLAAFSLSAQAQENIALNKPVITSSSEDNSLLPENAVDGISNSRWSSKFSDSEWIAVDLGDVHHITGVKLNWQNSYGRMYNIETSTDGINWSTAFVEKDGDGGIDAISLNATGRYVRMHGVKRYTRYGFSLWEFEVYGTKNFTNIALNKRVTASSNENASLVGNNVVDGSSTSRWSSAFSDNQWIAIDLGATHQVTGVKLNWQNSYGREYHIQTSDDGISWSTVFTENNGTGGIDFISVDTSARYVRMYGVKRFTRYGFSLWEFEVYGKPNVHNISSSKRVATSSNEDLSLVGAYAVDSSTKTRWSSKFSDNQWIAIDLEENHVIKEVKLNWQNSYAVEYQIQISNDGQNWTTVFTEQNGKGGLDSISLNNAARHVRMYGVKRFTRYGFSLWEFEVFGYPTANGSDTSSSSSAHSSTSSSSSSYSAGKPDTGSSSSSGTDTSAPTKPGNVKATGLESRIELSWSPAQDNVAVTGYQVYRNNTKVADVSAAVSMYVDTKVSANTNYTYTVRARDAAGNWSVQSASATAKLTTTTADAVTLRWSTPNARENGEYLELDEIGGFEIRYKAVNDTAYASKVINDNHTNNITLNVTGNYQFEIATFDSNGLYSVFVPIQPQ
jgi:uncharacterized protein CbrC (UPF0167 family)